jgi:hypothetical protein
MESLRDHGQHDIEEGFEVDTRSGLIIHDSCGYQSGGVSEVARIKKFIKRRMSMSEPKDALDAVW